MAYQLRDPQPAPIPGDADGVASGLDLESISKEVIGKVIPVSVGGRRNMAGYPIWIEITDTIVDGVLARTADVGYSFGFSADPDGVRQPLEIRFDTRVAYSLIREIATMAGLVFRFYPGTETQEPDPLAVARDGAAANAFRGQMVIFFQGLPLAAFDNRIPFISALICDSAEVGPVLVDFETPTATVVTSIAACDWTAGVMYTSGSYRLLAHRISTRAQIFDIPIVNLTSVFIEIQETYLRYCLEAQVLLAIASTASVSKVVAIDCDSGAILAEGPNVSTPLTGSFTYAQDTSTATPVIIIAVPTHSIITFYKYDQLTQAITELYTSAASYDGLGNGNGTAVVGTTSGGVATFHVAAGTKLIKCVIDVTNDTATLSLGFTAAATINNLLLDGSDGNLVLFLSSGTAQKLDTNYAGVWAATPGFTVPIPGDPPNVYASTEGWRRTRPYFVYAVESGGTITQLKIFDLTSGTVESTLTLAVGTPRAHLVFDSEKMRTIITDNGDPRQISFSGSSSDTVDKSDALTTLAGFFGYSSTEFEAAGITGTWIAIIVAYDTNFQDLVRLIAGIEGWDVIETGDKLKVVQRPLGDDLVIDHVVKEREIEVVADAPSVTSTWEEEVELPAVYEFEFIDPDRDYNWNLAAYKYAREPVAVTASIATETHKMPVVMSMGQAKLTIAAKAIRDRMARKMHSFGGMPALTWLEPGDIITLPTGIETEPVKLVSKDDGADYSSKIECESLCSSGPLTDPDFYEDGIFPTDPGVVVTPTFPADGTLNGFLLDAPLLNYGHDLQAHLSSRLRVYIAAATRGTFGGAAFVYKHASMPIALVMRLLPAAPLCGALTALLGTTPLPHQTDYVNTITLNPIYGTWSAIADITYLQLCNETQMFAVGRPGRWEIISAGGVTANADGTYTLDTLLRGLYGSDAHVGSHAVGDYIIRLTGRRTNWTTSSLNVWQGDLALSLLGLPITYQLIPFAAIGPRTITLSAVGYQEPFMGPFPVPGYPVYSSNVSGTAEKPWSPVHLAAVIAGSDINLSWKRRDRLDTGLHDSNDTVPMSETSLLFDIEILIAGTETIKRTYSNEPAASKTYPDADIITDFGAMPAQLKYRVYQRSATVARGFKGETTITL